MSDLIDLEREQNVKQHGPLGALLETSNDREPDEVDALARILPTLRRFTRRDRARMYRWLEERIESER